MEKALLSRRGLESLALPRLGEESPWREGLGKPAGEPMPSPGAASPAAAPRGLPWSVTCPVLAFISADEQPRPSAGLARPGRSLDGTQPACFDSACLTNCCVNLFFKVKNWHICQLAKGEQRDIGRWRHGFVRPSQGLLAGRQRSKMSSYTVSSLIEKLDARDKDERFMAMHDLAQDLDRDNIRLDGEIERRVVAMILKHLEDPGTDVKQQAVRTIASLARKVQETQLEEIAEKLATHILNNQDEEKRDIGSIGLKTLVGVLTQQTAPAVLKRVTPKLQQGITQSTEVVHYCLEILNDLLKGFGMIMVRDLGAIQSGILPLLSSDIPATRKRASTCVASLAICAPDQLFNTLVGSIFSNIETCKNADQIRTYIQTIAGISRTVGHRLGRELKRIIPLFMALCKDTQHQEDVEMLENCLQAFDSFVQRCPKEIGQHLDEIVATALRYIKFDPNYADEEEEDDAMDEVPPAARRPPPAARRPPPAARPQLTSPARRTRMRTRSTATTATTAGTTTLPGKCARLLSSASRPLSGAAKPCFLLCATARPSRARASESPRPPPGPR
jgi:hypothetical protein